MAEPVIVGARLRALRESHLWTQQDLARACGLSTSSISKWEQTERSIVRYSSLRKVAGALGVEATDLGRRR